MIMKNSLTVFLIVILLIGNPLMAAQSKVATTAAQFLGIGQGARALATGGAFSAVADDPSALYWNVAGAANLEKTDSCSVIQTGLPIYRINTLPLLINLDIPAHSV